MEGNFEKESAPRDERWSLISLILDEVAIIKEKKNTSKKFLYFSL